jgi:hypothetical protein
MQAILAPLETLDHCVCRTVYLTASSLGSEYPLYAVIISIIVFCVRYALIVSDEMSRHVVVFDLRCCDQATLSIRNQFSVLSW